MGLRKNLRRIIKAWRPVPSHGTALSFEQFGWMLSREPGPVCPLTTSSGETAEDMMLVQRIMAAYRLACTQYSHSASFWDNETRQLNADIHAALIGDDTARAAAVLRDPGSTTHFWGFDAIAKAPDGQLEPHEDLMGRQKSGVPWKTLYAIYLHDALTTLANAVGARRMDYPEAGDDRRLPPQTPDALVDGIERTLGTQLCFPNPYRGELGLQTRRGIIGYRAIQSLYQGWRIAQFANGNKDFRVLEIGAGLGRTAFYAVQFGIRDYTIVDIPLTGAAQGFFLGRTLGEDAVTLAGESAARTATVVPPNALLETSQRFDLIVNVDSLTEMAHDVAAGYWSFIKRSTPTFFSINHEVNPFTVRSFYESEPDLNVMRVPYWLRRGYVEETITFPTNG